MLASFLDWCVANKDAAPLLGIIVATLSVTIAITALLYTRAANRRRATLDFVMRTLMDDVTHKRYQDFKAVLRKDRDENDCFKIESIIDDSSSPDRVAMLQQLNVYELMALGIHHGLFDEKIYKRWYHNQFMIDYERSLPFIKGAQERKATIYCEMTKLYNKWEKSGHPNLSPGRMKMGWWGVTAQTAKIDMAREAERAR